MQKVIFSHLVLYILFLTDCSSIKKQSLSFYMDSLKDKKANRISYLPPSIPYKKEKHFPLDGFWWNPKSQSSISYFSNCSKVSKTLKEFQTKSFPKNTKILQRFQMGQGLYSKIIIPNLNGQNSYIEIYSFKSGSCYFNLNLVTAQKSSLKKEKETFKTFIKNFKTK